MKQQLYIDTDAGVDDIIAICMIISSGKFDVRGISVVNGVASVDQGAKNLARILAFLGQEIPIYPGINQRTQGSSVQFPAIDRKRANTLALLPDISLPDIPSSPLTLFDMQTALVRELTPVSFLCLGPLSNIKTLLKNRRTARNIQSLTIMGGAVRVPGIVPPQNIAEYNFRLDPVAADYVLRQPNSITLIPIDATRYVPTSSVSLPKKSLSPAGRIIKAIVENNQQDFNNFYDPLAAAAMIDERIITSWEQHTLYVSTKRPTMGKVIINASSRNNTIRVATKVKTNAFYSLMIELMQ